MEASTRILPASTNPSEVKGFFAQMKGKAWEAIVEQVRDGSTIRVYLLPSFHLVQVYIAGVQVTLFLLSVAFLLFPLPLLELNIF